MTDETLALMKAKGTFLVPDAAWRASGRAARLEKFPPAIAAKAKAAFAAHADMFRRALKSGVQDRLRHGRGASRRTG